MREWKDLPVEMQLDEVRPYYDILIKKKVSLFFKRVFDIFVSLILLVILSPLFVLLIILIKADSKGPVFFRQTRITQYGREFRIHKFRSMYDGAEKDGTPVTLIGDSRITKVGKFIRKYRMDELPQLIDVLRGDMSFVGPRPLVPEQVAAYQPEMMATLLLPAGVTSETTVRYKDEAVLLENAEDVNEAYIEILLPQKMQCNLREIREYSFGKEIMTMIRTVLALFGVIKPKGIIAEPAETETPVLTKNE